MADPEQNLDAFLTAVESKLRGPFSSLEIAKAAQTAALRGSLTQMDYLDRISQVISRTDKVIQMRILIGLLGLDPDQETDTVIEQILEKSQEAPLHEEWVRVVAGLVRGIMFEKEDGSSDRGKEASAVLEKTASEIIKRVKKLQQETDGQDGEPSKLATADVNPTFAPFRYALLNPGIMERVIPETKSHADFQVDEKADILSKDAKLELAKAQEEQEHALKATGVAKRPAAGTATAKSTKRQRDSTATVFPGFRSSTKPTARAGGSAAANRPKSSMFMPSRKPGQAAKAANATKPVLHQRKAGAAQALLAKGRRNRHKAMGGVAGQAAGQGVRGRALAHGSKFSNHRSKMKMIDVSEVQGLEQEKKEREAGGGDKKLPGQKRKAEAANDNSKVSRPKLEPAAADTAKAAPEAPKVAAAASVSDSTAGALASAALSAYQAQVAAGSQQQQAAPVAAAAPAAAAAPPDAPRQQDWRHLLKEKSNKLSADDRFRVQQFFVNRFNPTPDKPTYKMKLHVEETTDPKTGKTVKETYYLELDYTTFTSKQTKKIKRKNE